jgi:hypothetical protein
MKKIATLLIGVIFFSGCSTHQAWVNGKNIMVGTSFDPADDNKAYWHYYRDKKRGNLFYYKVEQEPPNVRYYINWTGADRCRYSLLVSPGGIILSWRYEDAKDPWWDCNAS